MTPELIAAFIAGLLGGTHCLGMCGGLVGALTFALPAEDRNNAFYYQLVYNLGRISSYMLLGAFVAFLGIEFSQQLRVPMFVLKLVSITFMVLMALYIMNVNRWLSWFETGGQKIWYYIQPISRKLLPINSLPKAYGYGMVWGWLPCGLVYSMLTWTISAQTSLQGALIMLAFGLGTSPTLLLLGGFAHTIKPFIQHQWSKMAAGIVMLGIAGYTASKL